MVDIETVDVFHQNDIQDLKELLKQEKIFLSDMIPNKKDIKSTTFNTYLLQAAVDLTSEEGGGIVNIPEGTFYFKVDNNRGIPVAYYSCNYVIAAKDNVTIQGAGMDKTVLKPYGISDYEDGRTTKTLSMFVEERKGRLDIDIDRKFLKNADFKDFTIDSNETTKEGTYDPMGKGFAFDGVEDCDWENITVKNTDSTGFGMDLPMNCTINNCTAINCGKKATRGNEGASGFGIGTGWQEGESIIITNCTSIGNAKYGFFVEKQYHKDIRTWEPSTYIIKDCYAKDNLYDFGANRGHDARFINCISGSLDIQSPFYTEGYSKNIFFENCSVAKIPDDVNKESVFYPTIKWAYEKGITTGFDDGTFRQDEICTRGQMMTFIWRYKGLPGNHIVGEVPEKQAFPDVSIYSKFSNAISWAADNKITTGFDDGNYRQDWSCTRGQAVTFLWRLSGEPEPTSLNTNLTDLNPDSKFYKAILWASENGITTGFDDNTFRQDDECTRGQMTAFLYRYNNLNNTK